MSGERWDYVLFRKWAWDMDYISDGQTSLPREVADMISHDLRLSISRIWVYWAGVDRGSPIYVPSYIVRSCRSLLALKRAGDELRSICRRHPHLAEIIEPVMRMVTP